MAFKAGRARGPGPRASGRKAAQEEPRIPGIVIGRLVEAGSRLAARVEYAGSPTGEAVAAISTAALTPDDVGREVALAFEGGDPGKPIVLGLIHHPGAERARAPAAETVVGDPGLEVRVDGERIL